MSTDDLALPTFVAAVVGTIIGALGLILMLALRYRDRVDLVITKVEPRESYLYVTVRNRGGSPTRLRGVYFIEGGEVASGPNAFPPLNGRSEVTINRSFAAIGREAPSNPIAIYAMDDAGRRSKPIPLAPAVRDSIRVSRPT